MNLRELTNNDLNYMAIHTFGLVQQHRRWALNQPKLVRLPYSIMPVQELFAVTPEFNDLLKKEYSEKLKKNIQTKEEVDSEYALFALDFHLLCLYQVKIGQRLYHHCDMELIPVPELEEQKALMDYQLRGKAHHLYGVVHDELHEETKRIEQQKEQMINELSRRNK